MATFFNSFVFLLSLIIGFVFIIFFCISPIKYDNKTLEAIGRKLKKNSVALDVVNFGESDDGKPEKLEALITAVNNNDSSHIVHVPAGQNALSDVLIRYLEFFARGLPLPSAS